MFSSSTRNSINRHIKLELQLFSLCVLTIRPFLRDSVLIPCSERNYFHQKREKTCSRQLSLCKTWFAMICLANTGQRNLQEVYFHCWRWDKILWRCSHQDIVVFWLTFAHTSSILCGPSHLSSFNAALLILGLLPSVVWHWDLWTKHYWNRLKVMLLYLWTHLLGLVLEAIVGVLMYNKVRASWHCHLENCSHLVLLCSLIC